MPRLSEEELASRRLGMGSTCIVEANGIAPWAGAGPMRLFCEKLGIAPPDDGEEDEDDAAHLEWGHVQEPVIADWYAKDRGVVLIPGGRRPSDEHPFMWATLDRKIEGVNKLVEVKNVGSPRFYRHWDTSNPDGVPDYVRAQVLIAERFTGIYECDVVAAIGGRPPHVWTVFYDSQLADMLIDGALAFWKLVESRSPPPMDHTPASKAYLRAMYPSEADKVMLEADTHVDELGRQRMQLALEEKNAKKERDRIDALLLKEIGAHTGIASARGVEGSGWRLTWKTDRNGVRRQRFTATGEDE